MKKYIWIVVVILLAVLVVWGLRKPKDSMGSLNIGVISTVTGAAAYIGESNMKGAEIGRLKAASEHPDLVINMYQEDSQFTPQVGILAYNKLRQTNNINALVTQGSNISVAVEPLAIQDNVLNIAASTLASKFSTANDLTARLTTVASFEAVPAVHYFKAKGYTRLGILYMNNEIGVSLNDALKITAASTTVSIVASEGYAADATDFRTVLIKLKSAGVDSIYIAGLAAHSAVVLKQAADLKIDVPFVSYKAAEDPSLLKAGTLAEKLVYSNAYDVNADSLENKDFLKLYEEKYNEKPNGYAAEAYEAVRMIADIYERCGDTVKDTSARSCAIEYISSTRDRHSVLGPISFDLNGDVSYPFFMKTIRDGQFVRIE